MSRQRILALLLAEYALKGMRVLHFAPDSATDSWLRRAGVHVVAVDLGGSTDILDVDVWADACNLPFPDKSFDLLLSSHVLEHVEDDRSAMWEMARVLRPGGLALVQVPLAQDRTETDEDPSVTEPAERKRRFGQRDHVRLYGMNIQNRLRKCGFDLQTRRIFRELSSDLVLRYGIWDDPIFVCITGAPEEAGLARRGFSIEGTRISTTLH